MEIDDGGFIIVDKDPFIFLDINYKECCKDIINKEVITMTYPFDKFIIELIGENKLKVILNQCKIDFNRSFVFMDDNKIDNFDVFF